MTKPFNQEEINKALTEHEEFCDITDAIVHCNGLIEFLDRQSGRKKTLLAFEHKKQIKEFASSLKDKQDRIIAQIVRGILDLPRRIDEQ